MKKVLIKTFDMDKIKNNALLITQYCADELDLDIFEISSTLEFMVSVMRQRGYQTDLIKGNDLIEKSQVADTEGYIW